MPEEDIGRAMDFDEFFEWLSRPLPRWKRVYYWFRRKPGEIKTFFLWRFHPRHRYNIVKTGLRPGYYDADLRMEAAIVKLFVDYIEIEKPFEYFETDDPSRPDNTADWQKIKSLYEYFRHYDPNRPPYDLDGPDRKAYESHESYAEAVHKHFEEESRIRDELTENLMEVVRLRGHYWT